MARGCLLSALASLAFLTGCNSIRNRQPDDVAKKTPVEAAPAEQSDSYLLIQGRPPHRSGVKVIGPHLPGAELTLVEHREPSQTKTGAGDETEVTHSLKDGSGESGSKDRKPFPNSHAQKPAKEEPIVEALRCVLADRYSDAIEVLKAYDPATQELYIRLLPVLVGLSRNNLNKLSSPEIATLNDQLLSLLATLRPRTELTIGKACYCEWIRSYGIYKPLPDGHGFAAPSPGRHGDEVHLYVELKNFSSELRGATYETRLSSSLEIRPSNDVADSKPMWEYKFPDRKLPVSSRTMLNDYYQHYIFEVPLLPPGAYTLTLQIADETRSDIRRVARKSLEFRVNSVSARIR